MSLRDLVDKAKEWAGKNPDKADQGVDRGSDMIKKKFAGHDSAIDAASGKAKNYLHGSGNQGQDAPPGQAEPPAPAQRSDQPEPPGP